MIPKYSINFSWKKPGKSPRASGLLDPGFGRAGPRKNGSGGRVLQARPVARNITTEPGSKPKPGWVGLSPWIDILRRV